MGLSGSPLWTWLRVIATFERLNKGILGDIQWTNCLVYLDEIIVFGTDFKTAKFVKIEL